VHPYIIDSVGELHGSDVSSTSLDVARRTNPQVRYLPYDGDTLPYETASFDCAYAICVMHHVPVPQWTGFLREMRRVVRPGGAVVIIEHNPLNPATQWVVRTAPMDANAVLLSPWKLHKLMKAAGIGSLWIRYVLFMPFTGKLARAIDRLLARVPLGTQYVLGGRV
jgi:ubiquinone/menaquinone biosynthesis C-methylase UbiE